MIDRRTQIKLLCAAAFSPADGAAQGSAATSSLDPFANMRWRRSAEGARRADLGDGRFLNPVFSGDHPDPAIVRDGDQYYLTFSSFDAYPGLLIWRSVDLVNWRPIATALSKPIGSVWAPCLTKHAGRFYCYIPARSEIRRSIYVISADCIDGPWSDPIDLALERHIDPEHVVDLDGARWLFLSGGDRVRLSADGLSIIGDVEHVYDPWRYPEDWDVESFSPEGPKIFRRDGWWHLITAVGGTAGPPTSHMVVAARSRSLSGPWENCPHNPIIRTKTAMEKWWSRGHATLIEGPGGDWWAMHHGYENGYWTLGRQMLLAPVRWRADGWPEVLGRDLAHPLKKPLHTDGAEHGLALSDDFSTDRMGVQWSFYEPGPNENARLARKDGAVVVRGKGRSPSDCSPLSCIAGDQRYRVEVDVEVEQDGEGGLLLFYNRRLYAGLGIAPDGLVMHRYGLQRRRPSQGVGRAMRIRLTNDRNILTIHTRPPGKSAWRKFDVQMEVSGYHHNVAYDFLSLRPALYAAGGGQARFRNFTYQAF